MYLLGFPNTGRLEETGPGDPGEPCPVCGCSAAAAGPAGVLQCGEHSPGAERTCPGGAEGIQQPRVLSFLKKRWLGPVSVCVLFATQGEEGPPSLEYIQAKDLFPQKELVKEEESLQVRE